MDIRFTKSGEPTFVALGPSADGSAEARGPEGLTVGGGPVIETVQFLRASSAKLFNRGNRTFTMSFGAWRQHASIEVAEDFALSHPGSVPTAAGMVCTITLNSGLVRYLTTPFIRVDSIEPRGLRTLARYTLSGGQLQASNTTNS